MAPGSRTSQVDVAAVDAFVTASRALIGLAIRSVNAAPVEITLPQHRLMVLLATAAPRTIGGLATELGVDQSNASRLCDRLEKLGLISRSRSAKDRRSVEVSLTHRGSEVLDTVDQARRREVGRVCADLSTNDLAAAARALSLFTEAAGEAPRH